MHPAAVMWQVISQLCGGMNAVTPVCLKPFLLLTTLREKYQDCGYEIEDKGLQSIVYLERFIGVRMV